MPETFVMVGASLAGGSAAAALRRQEFEGRIILVGEEPEPPYERPPLSKEYLRGETEFDQTLLQPLDFYGDNDIETHFGRRATLLDVAAGSVMLAGGEEISYDRLLLATGGRNRALAVPGADLDSVFGLRTRADADGIRAAVAEVSHVVVVGMGFIGAEVAASLRERGLDVTAVEPFPVPLMGALGEELGGAVAALHVDHGVNMVLGDTVVALEGRDRVEAVRTETGRKIDCDFVVVGVGIEPNVDLVEGTGIAVDNGIVVDELSRTNVEGVYAAGDVANHFHPLVGRHIRVEHWQNAIRQGDAAARSMMGKGEPYTEVHWFWSDQYDTNIQYAGFHGDFDETVTRGDMASREFVTFRLVAGRVQAVVGFNRRREVRAGMRLIAAQQQVEARDLRNPDVDLRSLLR